MATAPVRSPAPTPLSLKVQRALGGKAGYVALTADEERDLGSRARAGDEAAAWALVLANQGFVRSVAARHARAGVAVEDLVSEGLLGLREAARRFDPARRIKFITYGSWWARRAILSHLRRLGHPVHVPKYKHREMQEVAACRRDLTQRLGRTPLAAEVASAVSLDVRLVEECTGLASRPEDAEAPAVQEAHAARTDARSAEDEAVATERDERLARALPILTEREALVLRHRFGLGGAAERTLTNLGADVGVTKERVRQIEVLACARLRAAMEDRPIPAPPAVRPRHRVVRCA